MRQHLAGWRWLINVEETAQVNAAHAQVADVHGRVFEGLELESGAELDSVGRLVIASEANNYRVAEETAGGKETARTSEGDGVRIGATIQQVCNRLISDEWITGKREEPRSRVLVVFFIFAAGELANRSAAG